MVCILGKLFSPNASGVSFLSVLKKIAGFTGVQITSVWMFLYCYKTVTAASVPLVFNVTEFFIFFLIICGSTSCFQCEVLCRI